MIPELKHRLFISLSQKAKHLPKHHASPLAKKISKKHQAPINHLSLKNQRRIKRLRDKKESDKDIVKLLRQEANEHKMTREQLQAAIDYLKFEHKRLKESVKKSNERVKVINQLKKQLDSVKSVLSTMSIDDSSSMKLQTQVVRIEELIKEKESELSL